MAQAIKLDEFLATVAREIMGDVIEENKITQNNIKEPVLKDKPEIEK